MRDINRIDTFLAEFGKLWKENVPDWRFMQLIANLPFDKDPFYMEEDEFLEFLNDCLNPKKNADHRKQRGRTAPNKALESDYEEE